NAWGDPFWWPGRDAWEVAAGAVLTQNTSWKNVVRALANLEQRGWTTASSVSNADSDELGDAIRPSRYYNMKTRKLHELADWWVRRVDSGEVKRLSDDVVRSELLNIWGVGEETADAIACYALGRPFMTVDAYTIRIAMRVFGKRKTPTYSELQRQIMNELPRDTMLLNHFHGLLDVLGHHLCTLKNPGCYECPLSTHCKSSRVAR
ncbi:MAG: hypothetical protein V2A56_02720, partial [bacterium]